MKTKGIPHHVFLFAAFPTLSLLSSNLGEVNPHTAIRPLLFSLILAGMILCVLRIFTKRWDSAGVLTTMFLLLFFSYGQVYQALKPIIIWGSSLGRHRFLLPIYALITLGLILLYAKRCSSLTTLVPFLNLSGILLVILPIASIFINWRAHTSKPTDDIAQRLVQHPLAMELDMELPDIYYIILDGYTRADVLEAELGYDNSPFINRLSELDFYVADQSQANYNSTRPSITTALNMAYLPEITDWAERLGLGNAMWILLKQSLVRAQLERIGYKTVAFETEYEWSRISDADIYLSLASNPLTLQRITPFEALLVKSTAIKILLDSQYKLLVSSLKPLKHPHEGHIEIQRFILDQLPKLTSIQEPTLLLHTSLSLTFPMYLGQTGKSGQIRVSMEPIWQDQLTTSIWLRDI